jgi:hypothetical protein
MLTVIFGLASLLAMFALGFVLGRVWEIRQEIRLRAQAPSGRPTRTTAASQLNHRF